MFNLTLSYPSFFIFTTLRAPRAPAAPTIKVNNMEPTRSPLPHAQYTVPAVYAQPQEPCKHAA